jgi:hypothetical protein
MKRFVSKLIIFFLIAASIQLFLGGSFKKLSELRGHIRKNVDVLYFGSSVDYHSNIHDKDKRKISEMVQSGVTNLNFASISNGAYDLEVFNSFIRYIVNQDHHIGLYILEINLRSFSPDWDKRPNYQFKEEKFILKYPYLEPYFTLFHNFTRFDRISDDQFHKTPVYKGDEKVGSVRDFNFIELNVTDAGITKKLIYHYLYPLDQSHSKLISLKGLLDYIHDNNLRVLFFIAPIDWQTGNRHLPEDFMRITRRNITIINSLLSEAGADYLDLSYALDSSDFSFEKYPNEHLKEQGRLYVAKRLSDWIRTN